ncbi:MAG: flagellar FliJ family protein [Chitinivibrionales bacterium]|nr:flagellar FliJ family protein [Chitinivibrionales bacterium]
MKRFNFRLMPVLELKKRKEDTVKYAIAGNNRARLAAQQQLEDIGAQLKGLYESEGAHRSGRLDPLLLRQALAFRHKLGGDVRATNARIKTITAEAAGLRTALIAARKETRVLELIKEKRFTEWKEEAAARQQQFVDDVSQQNYVRKLHRAAADRYASG